MWDVYVSGNFEMIVAAYNALAMMFSDGHNIYYGAAVLALLKLLITALQKVVDDQQKPVHNFFFGLIIFIILTGPQTRVTVLVESRITSQVQTIDNVPLLVAISGSVATTLLSRITDDFRTAFSVVTPLNGYDASDSGHGGLDPLRSLMKLNQEDYATAVVCMMNGNLDLCGSLNNYMRECVGRDMITGGPAQEITWTKILNSPPTDALLSVKSTNTFWQTQTVVKSGTPAVKTCADMWTYLVNQLQSPEFKAAVTRYNTAMGIKDEAVQQATRMFTGSGIGMYEMSLQRLVWSQVKKGTREAQDSVGRQTAEMQYTASEQRLVKMASSYEMFNELAPALITFFEFFAIFVAPVMLLMLVTGSYGLQAAGSYVMFVLFTNLWPLIAVGVESYINYALSSDMSTSGDFGPAALSWNGTPGVAEKAQTYLAVGSMMMAAIPSLAMAVLYKGVQGMAGVASKASPEAPVNSHYVAPNISSAPDNGKTAMGEQTASWDPNSFAGSVVGGAENLGLTADIGGSVKQSLDRSYGSAVAQQRTSAAQFQNSVQEMVAMANTAGSNQSFSREEGQQLQHGAAALANSKKIIQERLGVSEEQATQIAKNGSKGYESALQGFLGFNIAGTGGGYKTSSGDKYSESTSKSTGTTRTTGYDRSTAKSTDLTASEQATLNEASKFLRGETLSNSAEYRNAATRVATASENYAENRSTTEQMREARDYVQSGALAAKTDFGRLGQTGEKINAAAFLQNMASDPTNRESLVKAGVIESDGTLSKDAEKSLQGYYENAMSRSNHTLSEVAAWSVASASLLGETAFKLVGGLDNDDRNVAHEMLTRLDKSNPDVGLQQMIKMLETTSHHDEITTHAGVGNVNEVIGGAQGQTSSGMSTLQGQVEANQASAEGAITAGAGGIPGEHQVHRGTVASDHAYDNGRQDVPPLLLKPNQDPVKAAIEQTGTDGHQTRVDANNLQETADRKLKGHQYAASPEGSGTNAASFVMNLTYPGEAPRTPTGEGKGSDQGMVNTDVPAGVQEGKRPVTPDEQLPLWKR